jgi:hypothetical protein
MEQSILTSTKKILGIADDYIAFDHDVIVHINSTFSTLTQLGLGPISGFQIEDATSVWADFIGEPYDFQYNAVKSYVYLKVRMLFDPPATSYIITAMEKQIQELEWRLNVRREEKDWVDPNPPRIRDDDIFADPVTLDGGGP